MRGSIFDFDYTSMHGSICTSMHGPIFYYTTMHGSVFHYTSMRG